MHIHDFELVQVPNPVGIPAIEAIPGQIEVVEAVEIVEPPGNGAVEVVVGEI